MPLPALVRPKALHPGDLVAIAPVSSQVETEVLEQYQQGVAEIEALGFRVRATPLVGVDNVWWWASGRPGDVAADLNAAFRDPEVRAVWALMGGRFTISYIDQLDYGAIAADPKPLIGMSDVTSLLLAIHSRTGLVTFHADGLLFGVSEWPDLGEADHARQAEAYGRVLTSTEPAGLLPALSTWETWRPGRAEGPLVGGLLHRVLRIQATPWALPPERFDGAILFLEDLNVPTINVWHDLHVLRLAGVLDRIAGLVIGPVETINVDPAAPQTLREVVLDVLGDRHIPVIGNANLGHAGPNLPLPIGIRAAIDADALTLELVEPAVA